MKDRTKGAVAGVAGIALLAGGSTFALWTDASTAQGGTISAGNLHVQLVNDTTWQDVSDPDRDHAIADLAEFRTVPGDTIEGKFEFDAALKGDNMLATLSLTVAGEKVGWGDFDRLAVTYSVQRADGTDVLTDIPLNEASTVKVRSKDNSVPDDHEALVLPPHSGGLDGVGDFTVVVEVAFDHDTPHRELVHATAALEDFGVLLEQYRPDTADDDA